ncbi:MAG TPA: hypothetical protein VHJ54_05270 [Solirubrobacterales bacterium]|jgi:hypothetical protein|nr:hypothetical protein [Solirubrobacterales bacterium]
MQRTAVGDNPAGIWIDLVCASAHERDASTSDDFAGGTRSRSGSRPNGT